LSLFATLSPISLTDLCTMSAELAVAALVDVGDYAACAALLNRATCRNSSPERWAWALRETS
jgi:hypothetical protein